MTAILRRVLICATAALVASSVARAATLYVDAASPYASDKNPGTDMRPLMTIGAAADKARPGDRVLIRPGVYRESIALKKGGVPGKPITFESEYLHMAVMSGADPLKGWKSEGRGVYSVPWARDFVIGRTKEGKPQRSHGAEAPVGCAEQIIWDSRPLKMVMERAKIRPGSFYVDWEGDRLYVRLPGDVDVNTTAVYGCTRQELLSARRRWGVKELADHVVVKGLVFRHAATWAQRGAVVMGNNWLVEDCIVEWCNAASLSVAGSNAVLRRTITQDNGQSGLGGSNVSNILIEDCISRRNNWKGFPVGWEGGGGKFLQTDRVTFRNHTAYGNLGPGIWFDWDNTNFTIENCKTYGNYGNKLDWEGIGIFIEANHGPGKIVNNIVYSNTGNGIGIAETENLLVEGNVLVDNGQCIGIRAIQGRAKHKIENLTVRGNRFKDWRGTAMGGGLGEWDRGTLGRKNIIVENNVFDPPQDGSFMSWAGETFGTLQAARAALGVPLGRIETVPFPYDLVATSVRQMDKMYGITEAISGYAVGATCVVPVSGRTSIERTGGAWRCKVFDMSDVYVTVELPSAGVKDAVERVIPGYPVSEPVMLQVKLPASDDGSTRLTALAVGKDIDAQSLERFEWKKLASKKKTWMTPYGSAKGAAAEKFEIVDLRGSANRPMLGKDAWIGHAMPHVGPGRLTVHGVPFEVIDQKTNGKLAGVAVRSKRMAATFGKPMPAEVGVPVGKTAKAVYLMHACGYGMAHEPAVRYEFVLSGGATHSVDVVPYGNNKKDFDEETLERESNIQDWWPGFTQFDNDNAHGFLITSANKNDGYYRYLYTMQWVNPDPTKRVESIRMVAIDPAKDASIMVIAATVLQP